MSRVDGEERVEHSFVAIGVTAPFQPVLTEPRVEEARDRLQIDQTRDVLWGKYSTLVFNLDIIGFGWLW